MTNLNQYKQISLLHDDGRVKVVCAEDICSHKIVNLKIVSNSTENDWLINRLHNEYYLANILVEAGLSTAKPLQIIMQNDLVIVVYEDYSDKVTLAEWSQSYQFTLQEILQIFCKIAKNLSIIHDNAIIHKNINPTNILLDVKTQTPFIVGFEASSQLDIDITKLQYLHVSNGNFFYISPEQTGRMNRTIDYRSDFYSLGVVLYELLASVKPIIGDSPLEIIYHHLTAIPENLHKIAPDIAPVVSNIVMKMLEKNIEDRYQSAMGIYHDIMTCLQMLSSGKSLTDFQLAKHDVPLRFEISQKLYGRDVEIEKILSLFEKSSQGAVHCLMVVGLSGVGKSSLISEINKPLAKTNGVLIVGKNEQFNRTPYQAFSQALNQFVEYLLMEPPKKIALWKEKINQALHPNGQLIIDIAPDFEKIIGKQPAVQELPTAESQNRLFYTCEQLVKVISNKDQPLILFLDDMQWSDMATYFLLKHLCLSSELKYLLIIGSYRDDEVDKDHILIQLINEVEKKKKVEKIVLGPLDVNAADGLICDSFRRYDSKTHALVELVLEKTKGNPFYVKQILHSFYRDGLIKYDDGSAQWEWSEEKIKSLDISDNVIDFMCLQLYHLKKNSLTCLQYAACVGYCFDLKILLMAQEITLKELIESLLPAIKFNIILPLSLEFQYLKNSLDEKGFDLSKIKFKFQHDKVLSATYLLMNENEKKLAHYKIAKLLYKSYKSTELASHAIIIAQHFNNSLDKLCSAQEKYLVIKLNHMAAVEAFASNAHQYALTYVKVAKKLLSEQDWQEHYTLVRNIYFLLNKILFHLKERREAEEDLKIIFQYVKTPIEKAEAMLPKINYYLFLQDAKNAENAIRETLKLFNVNVSKHAGLLHVVILYFYIRFFVVKKSFFIDTTQFEKDDTKKQQLLFFIWTSYSLLFHTTETRKTAFIYMYCKAAIMQYREKPSVYRLLILVPIVFYELAREHYAKAHELSDYFRGEVEKNDDILFVAQTKIWLSHYDTHLNQHWRHISEEMYAVALLSRQSGYVYTIYNSLVTAIFWQQQTSYQSRYDEISKLIPTLQEVKGEFILDHAIILQFYYQQMTATNEADLIICNASIDAKLQKHELEKKQFFITIFWYKLIQLMLATHFNKCNNILSYAKSVEKLFYTTGGRVILVVAKFYVFLGYTMSTSKLSIFGKMRLRLKLYRILKYFAGLAAYNTDNFLHQYTFLQGEFSRVRGNMKTAINKYIYAIELAEKNDYPEYAAIYNERLATLYLLQGNKIAAATCLQKTYSYWQSVDAFKKMNYLQRSYRNIVELTQKIAK